MRLEADPSAGTERARASPTRCCRCSSARATTTASAGPGRCARRRPGSPGRVASADARGARPRLRPARGDERELFAILGWRATAAVLGPTPVDDAIRRCEAFRELVGASPVAVALEVNPLASLHAMQGDFELAERSCSEANETLHQLGSLG